MYIYNIGSINLLSIINNQNTTAATSAGQPTADTLVYIKTFIQRITDKKFAHIVTTIMSERYSIYSFPVSLTVSGTGGGYNGGSSSRISGVSSHMNMKDSIRVSSPSLYSAVGGPSMYAMDEAVIEGDITNTASCASPSARNTNTTVEENVVLNPLNQTVTTVPVITNTNTNTTGNNSYTYSWFKGRTTTPDIVHTNSLSSMPLHSSLTNTTTQSYKIDGIKNNNNNNNVENYKSIDTIAILYFTSITK